MFNYSLLYDVKDAGMDILLIVVSLVFGCFLAELLIKCLILPIIRFFCGCQQSIYQDTYLMELRSYNLAPPGSGTYRGGLKKPVCRQCSCKYCQYGANQVCKNWFVNCVRGLARFSYWAFLFSLISLDCVMIKGSTDLIFVGALFVGILIMILTYKEFHKVRGGKKW